MEVVIVSDARTVQLRQLTVNAIESSGVNCIVIEANPDVVYSCQTIHYDFPFNYNRCLNLGYSLTESDVICFANNDVIFGENWTESGKYLKDYGSISLLNPGWGFHKDFTSGVYEGYNVGRELCGWALIVSRETMEKTGGFDEDVKFWCSDNIWSEQLRFHGIKHAIVADYYIKHLTSKTLCSGIPKKDFAHMTGGQAVLFQEAKKKYQ